MNKDNILKVAAAIEAASPKKFNMSQWFGDEEGKVNFTPERDVHNDPAKVIQRCNTAACVAGWTLIVRNKPWNYIRDDSSAFLGLNYDTAESLFQPRGYRTNPKVFTSRRAVAVLRHLAETSEVAWEKFGPRGGRVR